MARMFPATIGTRAQGTLQIEEVHPNGHHEIYYIPPAALLKEAGITSAHPEKHKKVILEASVQDNFITIYPISTLPKSDNFLAAKYSTLADITLSGFDFGSGDTQDNVMGILESLPTSFVKDYDYGLGFTKDFRFIVSAVSELKIKHLIIENDKSAKTGVDEKTSTLTIRAAEFKKICKEINKVTNEARKTSLALKTIRTHNLLAYFLHDEKKYPQKDGRQDKLLGRPISGIVLNPNSTNDPFQNVKAQARKIAERKPQELLRLKSDLELISLEKLISRFEDMIKKRLAEDNWQDFFNDNPFILNLAFGFPVVKVRNQASVGGKKLSGKGEKIADFLVKNSLSNNVGLFEIKTPTTKVLNKTAYRDGIFGPSADFSGALNQLLDQKYQLEKLIMAVKETSRIYDLESYVIHGVLIIGTMPSDKDEQKSLELFRGNSKNVAIFTFDELLAKLKNIYNFLADDKVSEEDLPF